MSIDNVYIQAQSDTNDSSTLQDLEKVRIEYLGRKGKVTQQLKSLSSMTIEERKHHAPQIQKVHKGVTYLIEMKKKELAKKTSETSYDLSLPGEKVRLGHIHPLTRVQNDINDIFTRLNFSIVEGPELESEEYNFDRLNIPDNHPARDMWDTFWIKPRNTGKLLRTHTSPMQVRYMQKNQPPFQIIVPGRVFRHEATDFSHEFNFHQIEGLMIGEDVSLAHLKYVIQEFFSDFFHRTVKIRFRPSYFPFTEPSVEVDVFMTGKGWLEMGGAGMVHPSVLKGVGYDTKKWQGFAFGFGIERLAMIKYAISDIRLFHSGDLRFIKQF